MPRPADGRPGQSQAGSPPLQLVAALARLQALASAGGGGGSSSGNAPPPPCDGGGDFGCAACAGAVDLLGDRLAAFLRHGPVERAEFLAAGGARALVVSFYDKEHSFCPRPKI